MKEKAFLFGDHQSLLGITSEPAHGGERSLPAVLLLNAGIVHRVGPHRKSVRLARRLAEAGFLVMRYDQAGVGDSEPRRDALGFAEGARDDIRQAMDHLQRTRQVDQFVLIGLCSGADNSYQMALRDERIVGITMIDGYAYKTPGYYLRYYGVRAQNIDVWRRFAERGLKLVERRVRRALTRTGEHADGSDGAEAHQMPDAVYVREFPPREEVAEGLQSLVDRGVELNVIYSGGIERYYNYRRQFIDSFADVHFKGRLNLRYFDASNHTFTEMRNQEALISAVYDWAVATFAGDFNYQRASA